MPLPRRIVLALVLSAFSVPAVFAHTPRTCTANAGLPPLICPTGLAGPAGDIVVSCIRATPVAAGQPVPALNWQVSLNTSVTSRILLAGAQTWTEALLLVDEPQPETLRPCLDASGVCPVLAGDMASNVSQGALASVNAIAFPSIPLNPSGSGPSRVFRIVSLQVNASQLTPAPSIPAASLAFPAASGGIALPIASPEVTIVDALQGLKSQTPAADFNGDGFAGIPWPHPPDRDVWTWLLINGVCSASSAPTGSTTCQVHGLR